MIMAWVWDNLIWFLWALSGLGVVGLILLAIFAPAVFAVIEKLIVSFVTSTIGMVLIALVIGLLVGMTWQKKTDSAFRQAAEARAEQAAKERDENADKLLDATNELNGIKQAEQKTAVQVTDYGKDLENRYGPVLPLPDKPAPQPATDCDDGRVGLDLGRLREFGGIEPASKPANAVRALLGKGHPAAVR